LALLEDHAHLERKAASNALALLTRWPRRAEGADAAAGRWTRVLASVAKDESEHLALVVKILGRRGGVLGRVHANPYAAALHALVRRGRGADELVDRLLVCALIEARSCERFERLAEVAEDDELRRLYRGLLASERGHFRIFLDLARDVPGGHDVEARWNGLLDEEARVLAAQSPGARMHAGDRTAPAPPIPGPG
jgi:tRNA-(ms[2]io[6]A)-hydroxylase